MHVREEKVSQGINSFVNIKCQNVNRYIWQIKILNYDKYRHLVEFSPPFREKKGVHIKKQKKHKQTLIGQIIHGCWN